MINKKDIIDQITRLELQKSLSGPANVLIYNKFIDNEIKYWESTFKLLEEVKGLEEEQHSNVGVKNDSEVLETTWCNCIFCRDRRKKEDYLEPLNFDFDDVSSHSSTSYIFQEAINNIVKVLNKLTQDNEKK